MVSPRTLRFRMIALFCTAVGVILVGFHLAIGVFLWREVRNQLDRQLLATARPVMSDLVTDPADETDVNQLNVPNSYFELIDPAAPGGRILQMSKNLEGKGLDLGTANLASADPQFLITRGPNQRFLRMALIPFQSGDRTLVLAVAAPNRLAREVLEQFIWIVAIFLPVSLLLTGVVSTWYVGRSLAPIAALTERAREVMDRISQPGRRRLWTPLKVEHPADELGQLAWTFNELFSQIDSALHQLRQFVTDASHELRTPLSVLRGETELLLSAPRSSEEYQRALQVMDGELRKLTRMVEGLFTLSMADAGQLRLLNEPVYLNEVLDEACQLAAPAAQKKGIAILRDLKHDVPYHGDEAFLRQLFLIFLDNAVKYSSPRTSIRVHLDAEMECVSVRFEDQGAGISNEDLPHIFERFYRAAGRASGETQSGGLGLAIAQAIVQAQGGSIKCQSSLGTGSTFTVRLPLHGPSQVARTADSAGAS